jgi:hypothetical protein
VISIDPNNRPAWYLACLGSGGQDVSMLGRSSRKVTTSTSLKKRESLLEIAESWFGHTIGGMVRNSLCFSP